MLVVLLYRTKKQIGNWAVCANEPEYTLAGARHHHTTETDVGEVDEDKTLAFYIKY